MKVRSWFNGPESVFRTLVAFAVVVSVAGAATGGIQFAEAAIIGGGDAAESASLMTDQVVRTKVESLEETASVDLAALTKASQKKATPVAAPRARAATSAVRTAAAVKRTSSPSTSGWKSARVSWYGPGFYGNTMAGGGKLTTTSMVVAHRSMRFGTKIEFSYKGRTCVAVVRDRGPYVSGRTFDLGPGTAKALGFSGVGTVKWRIVK